MEKYYNIQFNISKFRLPQKEHQLFHTTATLLNSKRRVSIAILLVKVTQRTSLSSKCIKKFVRANLTIQHTMLSTTCFKHLNPNVLFSICLLERRQINQKTIIFYSFKTCHNLKSLPQIMFSLDSVLTYSTSYMSNG